MHEKTRSFLGNHSLLMQCLEHVGLPLLMFVWRVSLTGSMCVGGSVGVGARRAARAARLMAQTRASWSPNSSSCRLEHDLVSMPMYWLDGAPIRNDLLVVAAEHDQWVRWPRPWYHICDMHHGHNVMRAICYLLITRNIAGCTKSLKKAQRTRNRGASPHGKFR